MQGKKVFNQAFIIIYFFVKVYIYFITLSLFSSKLHSEAPVNRVIIDEYQVYDNYTNDEFSLQYEIWDGPGNIKIEDGNLNYYPCVRGSELAGTSNSITLDPLGRPYIPSLLIARQFNGDEWELETKITYNFEKNSNDSAISMYVVFDKISEIQKKCVVIERKHPGLGKKNGGSFYIRSFGSFSLNNCDTIKKNLREEYIFKIVRKDFKISVYQKIKEFKLIKEYFFDKSFAGKEQFFVINGMAFNTGASASVDYLYIKPINQVTNHILLNAPSMPKLFKKTGSSNNCIPIRAEDIMSEMKKGKNIEIHYASITGDLDLNKIRETNSYISNHLTFKSCTFQNSLNGYDLIISGNLSFYNCAFSDVNFSLTNFLGRVSFSLCTFYSDTRFIMSDFKNGANFTNSKFERRPFFRLSKFSKSVSFYYSKFESGADFSSIVFKEDVSFSDFQFSQSGGQKKTDMTFFHSRFHGETFFIYTLQHQPNQIVLGDEINFEKTYIENFVLSSGALNFLKVPVEQTGNGRIEIPCNMLFSNATIRFFSLKNLNIKGVLDLQGTSFKGKTDSIRFINVYFSDIKFDTWPIGKVYSTEETLRRLVTKLEEIKNAKIERIVYFDLLAGAKFSKKWLNEVEKYYKDKLINSIWEKEKGFLKINKFKWLEEKREDIEDIWMQEKVNWIEPNLPNDIKSRLHMSYRDYFGFKFLNFLLLFFWVISGFGTSIIRILLCGLILTFLLTAIFLVFYGKGSYFVRIKKELVFKFRLGETPFISSEKKIGQQMINQQKNPKRFFRRSYSSVQIFPKKVTMILSFCLNMVMKIGFGNIKLRNNCPKELRYLCWTAWALGYAWYILLLYTLTVIPFLKGVF